MHVSQFLLFHTYFPKRNSHSALVIEKEEKDKCNKLVLGATQHYSSVSDNK